jgi:ABC-type transport system involved in cytochrome bd biosynthesis fused ATPase/permease subunit
MLKRRERERESLFHILYALDLMVEAAARESPYYTILFCLGHVGSGGESERVPITRLLYTLDLTAEAAARES